MSTMRHDDSSFEVRRNKLRRALAAIDLELSRADGVPATVPEELVAAWREVGDLLALGDVGSHLEPPLTRDEQQSQDEEVASREISEDQEPSMYGDHMSSDMDTRPEHRPW